MLMCDEIILNFSQSISVCFIYFFVFVRGGGLRKIDNTFYKIMKKTSLLKSINNLKNCQ